MVANGATGYATVALTSALVSSVLPLVSPHSTALSSLTIHHHDLLPVLMEPSPELRVSGFDVIAKRLLLPTGLIATFFPCIVYAQNKRRYEHLNRGKPDPERGGSGFNGDCLMHGCITCCFGIGCVLQVRLRTLLLPRCEPLICATDSTPWPSS